MPLSLNEIRDRAHKFSKEWQDEDRERAEFEGSSLADLYDPLTMPPKLVKAHQELDKAVDLCYRPQAFTNEKNRIEYLFELYQEYTEPLLN